MNQYDLQKLSKKLERQIAQLEQTILKAQHAFIDLEYGTEGFNDNQKRLQQLDGQLKQTFAEWESIQKQLE